METASPVTARAQRYNVFLTATSERFGEQQVTRHRMRNLSAEGACIDTADMFRPNETLLVGIGTLAEVIAQVRWVRAGLAGLKFTHTIDINRALGKAAIPPKRHLE
ncbi:PilZ domain-containing protein [Sphingomonas tagetis]|uniref:PilZ domain-containing protein n=1 Tax=Sphingomonas tagetis TaxID=2949092 RepID=UPI00345E8EC5